MPSPAASAELFSHPCLTPRVEEGGVVLEATTDGVLCSQESTTNAESPAKSPAVSPSSKKARISPQSPDRGATTRLHSPTTLLARCDRPGVRYSVLVAVVHPCHLKEVKVSPGVFPGNTSLYHSVLQWDNAASNLRSKEEKKMYDGTTWKATLTPSAPTQSRNHVWLERNEIINTWIKK